MSERWTTWQAEQAGTNKLPGIWSVFLVLGVLAALALALVAGPTATAEGGDRWTRPTTPPPCARHWPPTCEESAGGG